MLFPPIARKGALIPRKYTDQINKQKSDTKLLWLVGLVGVFIHIKNYKKRLWCLSSLKRSEYHTIISKYPKGKF